jgi:hypothetical protein
MLDAYIQAATRRRSGHFEVLVRGADNASTFPPCQVSARVLRGTHVLGTTNVRRVVTRGWTSATLQLTRAGARLLRSKRRVRVAIRAADTCRRGARLRPAGSFLVDL